MAYIPPLNGGRINASIGGNSTSAGAGYAMLSTGTMVLAGGNNITLSQNGSNITISGANAPSGSINFSASNTSANLASVTFSNSNGLSFGLNAGVITGSYTVPTVSNSSLTIQAGASTLSSVSRIAFGDGNGISFGASTSNNGSVTITGTVATNYAASNHSHGNPTLNLTNLSGTTASASNGLTLSLSAAAPVVQTNQTLSQAIVGNTTGNTSGMSVDARSLTMQGLGAASVGISTSAGGSSLIFSAPVQTVQTQNMVSFGGSTGNIQVSNSNNVTFGAAGSIVTASASFSQTNQTLGINVTGNTLQTNTGTVDARSLTFNGLGNVSVGYSNGSVQISGAGGGGGVALYDGVNSLTSGTASLQNSNGVSFGINGQTVTASVAAQSAQTMSLGVGGNTTYNRATTFDARTLQYNAGGALSIGFTNGSMIFSAPAAFTQSNQTMNFIAGGNTTLASTASSNDARSVFFRGYGDISVGFDANNSIAISGSQSVQSLGMYATGANTVGQSSSSTFDARSMNFSGMGALSAGYSGSTMQLSAPAVSSLSATGAVSISTNGSTISIGAPAFSAGISGGNTSGTSGTVSNQLVFAGGNNIVLSQVTGAGGNSVTISASSQSNQTLGLYAGSNTTGQSSSSTFDARSLSFQGAGIASIGYSGGSVVVSVPTVAGAPVNVSAGSTSGNIGSVVFSNSNGVSFGLNGSTITASAAGGGGGGATLSRWEYPSDLFTTLPGIVNNSLSLQHMYVPFDVIASEMKLGGSFSAATHTSASTGSITVNLRMALYTLNGSTLSLATSGSGSTAFGVSSNSTSSINGMRQFTVQAPITMTQGEYWVGAILSTATNYASNSMNFTLYGNPNTPTGASNAILSPMGLAVTASPRDVYLFAGMYGTTTTAFPTAIQGSQINNSSASYVARAQFYNAIYNATY